MKHLRGIVESPTAPNTTDVLWLDADGGLKAFKNGEWKALVEKGSGGNNDNELILEATFPPNDGGEVNSILINNKEYKASIYRNEITVHDKDLFQYVISNYLNIKLILISELEWTEGDTTYIGKSLEHFTINEIRENVKIYFATGNGGIIVIHKN